MIDMFQNLYNLQLFFWGGQKETYYCREKRQYERKLDIVLSNDSTKEETEKVSLLINATKLPNPYAYLTRGFH